MPERSPRLPRRPRGAHWAALPVALVLGLWAFLFAQSSSANEVATRAERLAELDAVASELSLLQERLDRALVLSTAEAAGVVADRLAAGARDDLWRRLSRFPSAPLPAGVTDLSELYVARAEAMLGALEAGDLDSARRIAFGDLPGLASDLGRGIEQERSVALAGIVGARSISGTVSLAAAFVLVLAVPLVALVAHRMGVGRELRATEARIMVEADRHVERRRDEFIAGLSHELRTPLTGILGLAAVLAERYRLDPKTEDELIALLIAEASDLSLMVDDIVALARHEAGALTFALGAISVPEQVTEALRSGRSGQSVRVLLDDVDLLVVADPLRLRHVLCNLVGNARKHGGPDVRIVGRRVGGRYRIEVVDDGPGVPDEFLPRLFRRFVHDGATPLTTGTLGLGLAVARELVWGMGGEIWYERASGLTTFAVELPLASPGGAHGSSADPLGRIEGRVVRGA